MVEGGPQGVIPAPEGGVPTLRVPGDKPISVDCPVLLEEQRPRAINGKSKDQTDDVTTVGALALHVGLRRNGAGHHSGGGQTQHALPLRYGSEPCAIACLGRRPCSDKNKLNTWRLRAVMQALFLDAQKPPTWYCDKCSLLLSKRK